MNFSFKKIRQSQNKSKAGIRQKLILFSVVILLGNLLICFSVYIRLKKMVASENMVNHAEQVIHQSETILSINNNTVLSSLGFVVTNDSAFLEPGIMNKSSFNHIERLKELVRDNPMQKKSVDSLSFYLQKLSDFSLKTIELRRNEGMASAIAFVSAKEGKMYSDRIRKIIIEIQMNEYNILKQGKESNDRRIAIFRLFTLFLYILMNVLTILLVFALRKNLNQNEEKEKRAEELIIANKELAFQNEEKEKRAEELIIAIKNAEESDQLKSAFLRNMSHEIRTPLTAIIGFSNLLNEEDISKAEIKEYISIINQSGNQLIVMITNILDISTILTGLVKVNEKPILIDSFFHGLFTTFNQIARTKNIHLKYQNKNGELKFFYSDEAKLFQIFSNLINNAIKFSESGNVDFGYEIKENTIQFYVKDTGIGIPPELHRQIFENFRQAELSPTRQYEGSGLGLAICIGLLRVLGGKIWLESIVNKGSTFFFSLPYEKMNHR